MLPLQLTLTFNDLYPLRANVTFKCMALETSEDQYTDHSSCCEQRGVSPVCLSLCKGNVKRIGKKTIYISNISVIKFIFKDFRHFVCLDHMSVSIELMIVWIN